MMPVENKVHIEGGDNKEKSFCEKFTALFCRIEFMEGSRDLPMSIRTRPAGVLSKEEEMATTTMQSCHFLGLSPREFMRSSYPGKGAARGFMELGRVYRLYSHLYARIAIDGEKAHSVVSEATSGSDPILKVLKEMDREASIELLMRETDLLSNRINTKIKKMTQQKKKPSQQNKLKKDPPHPQPPLLISDSAFEFFPSALFVFVRDDTPSATGRRIMQQLMP